MEDLPYGPARRYGTHRTYHLKTLTNNGLVQGFLVLKFHII